MKTQRWVGLLVGAFLLGLAGGWAGQVASEPQPNMEAALTSLKTARTQLKQATSDKGGYRAEALTYVDKAIIQVERGIRYANRH